MNHQSNWEVEFERLYIRGDLEIDLSQNEQERRGVVPLKALKSFIASAVESAREEGRRHERREILAIIGTLGREWSPLPHNVLRAQGWNEAIKSITAVITSRESSEGGKCCERCKRLANRNYWPNKDVPIFDCINWDCECHNKQVA